MGGYVDTILRNEIREAVTQRFVNDPASKNMSTDTRKKLIQDTITLEENRRGLNTPIAVRNARHLTNALTLQLGRAIRMTSDSGSREVKLIILERLPATLLLMGTSQLILFFASIFFALTLSRRYGSFLDPYFDLCCCFEGTPLWRYGRCTTAG
jgi:peptide/nickel transport system permease protein